MSMLINGDCLEELPKLINDGVKVDLILTDIPYGTVKGLNIKGWKNESTEWDEQLPMEEMFLNIEKILRMRCKCILFSQEPYTSTLRYTTHFNMEFAYPLIWEKEHFANGYNCNVAPVSHFEDLSVWYKKYDSDDTHPLRVYAQKLLSEMGVTYKDIEHKLNHSKAEHFFYRTGSSQFGLCTRETYDELINVYGIDGLDCFKPYEELQEINLKFNSTFNPTFNLNGKKVKSNIFKYKKDSKKYHPTQKPVALLEDLIRTYTNPDDVVLDFTMGSGSTGVACANLNRKFIGIELDKDYYDIAVERIKEAQTQQKLI